MGLADVINTLPEFQWRNLDPVPCMAAPWEFAHDQSPREYPYRDGEGHDWTGMKALHGSATLAFVNTTLKYGVLYPTVWDSWREALFDGTAGDLAHPDLGVLRARILGGSVQVIAENTAGVIVSIQWVQTVEDLDKDPELLGANISAPAAAAAADECMAALDIDYPDGMSQPSLSEMINGLKGQVLSIGLSVEGLANQALGIVNQIIDDVTALNSTDTWPLLDNLNILADAILAKADAVSRAMRAVGKKTVTTDTTLDAFAGDVANTLVDVMSLNPSALFSPIVERGTTLKYYLAT